jgi:peroxiredoxin
MKFARIALVAIVLAGAGIAAFFALGGRETAPTVAYTLLDGSTRSTEGLKGKVVLVNFWATSCTTCMKEMPALVETHRKFQGRGFETLSVAMNYDVPAYVANYAQSRQLPFQVTHDRSGEIAKQFGKVQITPTTFVVDKQGHIVKRYVGEPDFQQLHALLEELLAKA